MSEQNDRDAVFSYSYSAKEQAEIRHIRAKYEPAGESSLELLRRLDDGVTRKGTVVSLCVGITGTLVMGGGMSMCMVFPDALLVPGIVVGVAGMAIVAAAYPLYAHITRRERERIAPQILRITQDLLK